MYKRQDEVIAHERNRDYDPMQIFNTDQDIRKVLMQLINGFYSPNDPELFRDLYNSLLNTQSTQFADTYFSLEDFRSYAEAQKRVMEAYKDCLLFTSCAGGGRNTQYKP